ncbi:hypothetical protein KHA80_17010 [Anaerobacillus sp. HL2]|nr:hypothetical protein KHA80_17010 [Anaerobacillus sp. HL2]
MESREIVERNNVEIEKTMQLVFLNLKVKKSNIKGITSNPIGSNDEVALHFLII